MSEQPSDLPSSASDYVSIERTFKRFTVGQRWEHAILMASFTVLLLTGLVQKYRSTPWSQTILSTPERLKDIQTTHHIFALILAAEVIYHIGRALFLIAKRRLSVNMLPTWNDIKDAGRMVLYLLFLTKKKPEFGKYNFEQKFTYWFLFFGIGVMVISGFIIWFPITATDYLPGGIIPAAKLAHSTEAVIAGLFVVVWHFYHVHFQRLNLSMFTGRLSEKEMREHHTSEYNRLAGHTSEGTPDLKGHDQ
jgi:formate dehydrogenase subunit gamma